MKKKPVFGPVILAVVLLLGLVLVPSTWVASIIPDKRVSSAATELNPLVFQGLYVQDKMLQDDKYLPIYGSSELSRLDRYHPSNYFKVNPAGFTPFLVGRGGSQSLVHFLNFAAHKDQLKNKKMVFILSAQWFIPEGSDAAHFSPNYSSLQGYDLAFNKQISPALKKRAMKRLLKFDSIKNDDMLTTLYKGDVSHDPWDKRKASLLRPFASFYKKSLDKKDLYYTLVGGSPRSRTISQSVKDKSWKQLDQMAAKEGKKHSKSNPFRIDDRAYRKMKAKVPSLHMTRMNDSFGKSPEYKDFQLVLDVLKEAKAKPLFVIVPVNGLWYDYMGFPKSGRYAFYNKVKKQVKKQGFKVADFSKHEYDPYFMKDGIHLGWKGWVHFDRSLLKFYNNN
ncbi:DltD [Fictibacillus macauensis ZFHKF-1]|uniref:Protein DltD n=1 Tax=Fictibacillus macauensis ZFHKF-1 TaxID=1196324 RepID=I8AMZ6_9BACL|nr:D-alanyl-lipoteichoic acid biosynthesis protein DltD [Fictibacillus macauensis]EIT87382.1 DltD [Fictibacillus macauensis ZFHKF-1]